ncbi:BamA/TamA family outer membrane protein [Calidifontimicrobium sp. SYSU G02091]|uniref:autotransporter assembly complex protein TamA n=1 Tax=Calidifontimicrobium sp. SYSU G02091 TaxID=2926421 RepID=UPI001F5313A5|nr:BamA/TamA family outer membrane protein [Calidifontimicrobium sp. SYSU G02091]MCI1193273.1 BamA/TamA family outer membrane protein [Calidifontimicrobium sp. SYSU G02091]
MTRARGAVAAALACAVLLGGCASLGGSPLPAPPPPAQVRLAVQAPAPLDTLLTTHLDLARLPLIAPGEPVGADELARLLAATPGEVRSLLQTEGYFEPRVDVRREADADDGTPQVTVEVDPGPRVRVAAATVDVQGDLDRRAAAGEHDARATLDAVRSGWALPPGAPFRNPQWASAKADVLKRLRADGYLAAQWSGTGAQIDVAAQAARLFVVADSGPLFRTGELRIEGLQRYPDRPVRHLAGFGAGAPATEQRLVDYQERLLASGLFDAATVSVGLDAEHADATPVTVRVREKPLHELTAGVGYSTNVGPRGSLQYTHRRPFGWDVIARNRIEVAQLRQAWDGELRSDPDADFWSRLAGGAYSREEANDEVTTSWRARLGRSRGTRRLDELVFAEVEQATVRNTLLPIVEPLASRTATAVSANYHVVWRDLDDVILPTTGQSLALQGGLGYSTSDDARSGVFTRLYGRYTLYRPFARTWYAQARVELGQVLRADGVQVPDTLRFRAGGENSVRGYDYRSLGPVVDGVVISGDVLFTGSVELARPLSARLPSLWGAVFVDAGRAAARWGDLKPAVGAGVGLRWRSPVGPLALDLAYGDELQRWRTHLSVGIVF